MARPDFIGNSIHRPVLVNAVLETLACRPLAKRVYLDCTVGTGGHAEAILNRSAPYGKVIGMDRDEEALRIAEKRLAGYSDRLFLRKGSFHEIGQIIQSLNLSGLDGILFDLGLSSFQLDRPERGFSFQRPGPLDMRMDRRQKETAADWVNRLSQAELTNMIQRYGEERWAKRIASGIVRYRSEKGRIARTEELEGIIWRAVPAKHRRGRIHPATRTFQALRMVVNQELEQMKDGLAQAISLMAVGGRLAIISFHSLEDRCAKQTFKEAASSPVRSDTGKRFVNLYRRPVVAGPEEISQNPRARSAKLRGLERAA
ncbi:MAG: 16S rRNA (cytosine(1402)-N(4))-methyltransferase RsmH [Nitrospiria bacterium]